MFQVQDEAAQAVAYLLAPEAGQTVLDACAGRGGKTAHIAALMNNTGHIVALDYDGRKLKQLAAEMQRLGVDIVAVRQTDLQATPMRSAPERFDRILIDAPCSGLGVIRRNPDAKWTRVAADIRRCARKQGQLLENIAPLLKPGGALVFAVCSTEPEETHALVASFLNKHADFVIDEYFQKLPPSLAPLSPRPGRLETLPHRHGTDGFFAVRLCHRNQAKKGT
jgi:16S rRNA (cytosine967-C5)-methyltransferase